MTREIRSVFMPFLLGSITVVLFSSAHQYQSEYTDERLCADILTLHNDYRLKHYAGPLLTSKTLSLNALKWASKLANEERLVHQVNSPYGENLYTKWSSVPIVVTAEDAFYSWYNEGIYYDYSREPTNQKAGHFTQIVWKNTQYLGIGVARNTYGRTVIVATYFPPGNYKGQFTNNVLRP